MVAPKLRTTTKRCPKGERYVFIKGVAEVPGMWINGKPVKISILEFNSVMRDLYRMVIVSKLNKVV